MAITGSAAKVLLVAVLCAVTAGASPPRTSSATKPWEVISQGWGNWIFPAPKPTYALLITRRRDLHRIAPYDPTWARDSLTRIDFRTKDLLLAAAWANKRVATSALVRRGSALRITISSVDATEPAQPFTASYEFLAVPKRLIGVPPPTRLIVRLQE